MLDTEPTASPEIDVCEPVPASEFPLRPTNEPQTKRIGKLSKLYSNTK